MALWPTVNGIEASSNSWLNLSTPSSCGGYMTESGLNSLGKACRQAMVGYREVQFHKQLT